MGGYCGTDSFHYFQMWLVGLGREAYDAQCGIPSIPPIRPPLPVGHRAEKLGYARVGAGRLWLVRHGGQTSGPAPAAQKPIREAALHPTDVNENPPGA